MTVAAQSGNVLRIAALLAALAMLTVAAFAGVLAVVIGTHGCASATRPRPAPPATRSRPATSPPTAGREPLRASHGRCWRRSARSRSDHGRSTAPGVQSGVNAYGCCAGPMQFNLRDGPPSTWQPTASTATATARRPLRPGRRDRCPPATTCTPCSSSSRRPRRAPSSATTTRPPTSPTSSRAPASTPARPPTHAPRQQTDGRRVRQRRSGHARRARANCATASARARRAPTPAAGVGDGRRPPGEAVDARLSTDALWLLRRYRLRVTAAREAGHNTHGDGTALDLVPRRHPDQAAWDASAGRSPTIWAGPARAGAPAAAPLPARAGHPVRRLRRLPRHGSPRTCSGACHRAPARLMGLAVLRHQRARAALRVGQRLHHPHSRAASPALKACQGVLGRHRSAEGSIEFAAPVPGRAQTDTGGCGAIRCQRTTDRGCDVTAGPGT